MSNSPTIYLWDTEGKAVFPNFLKLFNEAERLHTTKGCATKGLLAFAQDLALYQEAHIDDYDDHDKDCYYFIGRVSHLISSLKTVALAVKLPENWEEMFKVIVEIARVHNIVVMTKELTFALLPNGKMIPAEAAQAWDNLIAKLDDKNSALPRNVKEYQQWADPTYGKLLSAYGFKRVDRIKGIGQSYFPETTYVREVPIGKQILSIIYGGTRPYFGPGASFHMTSDVVDSIYHQFEFYKHIPSIFNGNLRDLTDTISYSQQPLSMALTESYAALMMKIILPIFDKAQDIKGLDEVMNGVFYKNIEEHRPESYMEAGGYFPNTFNAIHCIIVSRLANNPNFDQLIKYFERDNRFGANQQAYAMEWPKLVQYLREEVKPLV